MKSQTSLQQLLRYNKWYEKWLKKNKKIVNG